jgi:hypothetical protein
MMAGESVNYTNGWTPNMENFHLQCVQKAQGYAWMHFQASAFYTKLYLGLMIPCCILNVLVGSAGLASLSAIIGDPLWYLLLVIFGINILVGALGAVNGLLQPNLTSFQHRQLATEFVHLVRKLQAELLIEPARRIDCDDFGEMVNIEYENMLKNDLSVPEHIVHKFEESVNADTAMPEMILERGLRRDIFSAGTPRSGQSMSTQPVISMPPGRAEPIRRRVSEPCNSSRRVDSASERSRQNVPDVLPSSGSSSARVGSNWMTAFCAVQRARKGSARPSDSLMPDELPTSEPGVDNV